MGDLGEIHERYRSSWKKMPPEIVASTMYEACSIGLSQGLELGFKIRV